MKKILTISCLVFLTAIAANAQNVPYSDITLSSSGVPVGGAPIAVCGNPGLTTTAAQVISNIAVLTMSSNPITAGFVANQAIAVSGFTGADTYFNGGTVTSTGISNNFLILSVTSTQITYGVTHANASATTNGSVFQAGSQAQACAPLSSIFNDVAGASPITQPGLTSTGLGNYQFYAAPNSYYVQFFGATIGEILKPIILPPSTVNGATTLQCQNLGGVQCVNSTLTRGGADIGGEINLAYAALPANGGEIWIFPNPTNTAYAFTTPIVLGTANKIAKLIAYSPATPTPTQGLTLNYTPVTATTAITLDYDNGASGGGQNSHVAIEGITLMNNNCITVGGCGSSATGIAIGNTNGAQSAVFKEIRVSGFGTGMSNPNNNSWGQVIEDSGFTYNTTALNYVSAENTTLMGVKFVSNGTAITTAGGELTMIGGSLDSSTTAGFVCTGGAGSQINYLIGVHMENQNGQPAGANLSSHFFTGTCNMTIVGGIMENDNRSVNGTSDWLLNSSAGALVVEGTEMFSSFSGVLTTGFLNLVSPVRAKVSFIDSSPTVANPSCGGTGCTAANINRVVQGTNNNGAPWQLGDTDLGTATGLGDVFFAPNTAVGLHIRTSNAFDAIRTEDRTDSEVMDFGPGICGTTFFTFEDITNAVCALEYQFTTKKWLIPATVTGGLTVAPGLITPMASNTALQIFNTTTTCTTGAAVGATCTTANISLPVAEADTSYRVSCTGKGLTNVPVVIATANASASQFTITIAALTAAAASFTSYDCVAGHN